MCDEYSVRASTHSCSDKYKQKRHSVCIMQGMQQELERLTKERPTLTPRPTREVTPLKDLINNEKVSTLYKPP